MKTGEGELERLLTADPNEFRTVAEAMPHLVWIADAAGTVTYVNQRWSQYTGVTLEQLRNGSRDVGAVHPEDLDETWSRWNASLADGSNFEIEYRLRSIAGGEYRWFLGRATPMRDHSGTIVSWIGTATDIDEQRRLRDSLQFVVAADGVLAFSHDIAEICRSLAEVAAGWFADWCFVALARDDRIEIAAVAHRNEELLHDVQRFLTHFPIRPTDAVARVIAENRSEFVERVSPEQVVEAARDEEHLDILQRVNIRSAMLLPITTSDGQTFGALGAFSSESGRIFTDSDLKVAGAVASRAATAMANAAAFAQERHTSRGLRLAARINELLLETDDLHGAIERIAETIAFEIADGCAVMRLYDETVRTEFIVHRDPHVAEVAEKVRGQRTLRPAAERALARDLQQHRTIVYDAEAHNRQLAATWPHLMEAFASLAPVTTVLLPLSWGTTTYGALAAYFTTRSYDPERDLPVLEEAAARISVGIEKADTLERERRISTTLQRALLPTLIPQPDGIHLADRWPRAQGARPAFRTSRCPTRVLPALSPSGGAAAPPRRDRRRSRAW